MGVMDLSSGKFFFGLQWKVRLVGSVSVLLTFVNSIGLGLGDTFGPRLSERRNHRPKNPEESFEPPLLTPYHT